MTSDLLSTARAVTVRVIRNAVQLRASTASMRCWVADVRMQSNPSPPCPHLSQPPSSSFMDDPHNVWSWDWCKDLLHCSSKIGSIGLQRCLSVWLNTVYLIDVTVTGFLRLLPAYWRRKSAGMKLLHFMYIHYPGWPLIWETCWGFLQLSRNWLKIKRNIWVKLSSV